MRQKEKTLRNVNKQRRCLRLRALVHLVPRLGCVDKFEPLSGGGELSHAEKAVGKVVIAGGDGTVDLEVAEEAFDVIVFTVKRLAMLDFDPAV